MPLNCVSVGPFSVPSRYIGDGNANGAPVFLMQTPRALDLFAVHHVEPHIAAVSLWRRSRGRRAAAGWAAANAADVAVPP